MNELVASTRRAVVAIASLALAASSLAAPPSAETVIAESVAAMGGSSAVAKIDTLHTTSTVTQGMVVITLDAYWARSGQRLFKQSTRGMSMTMGYDGKIGWQEHPGGVAPLDAKKISELEDSVSMHMGLLTMDKTAHEDFRSVKSIDVATFGGRECNRLQYVTTDEPPETGFVFFDANTKLPVGWEINVTGPNGTTTERMILSDWKATNDLQFFRKVEMAADDDPPMIMRVTNVAVNQTAMDVFRAPESTRGFAKPPSGKAAAAKELSDFSAEQQEHIQKMLRGFMQMNDPDNLEGAANALEASSKFLPADQKEATQYVIAKVRERVKQLRGS